MEASTSYQSQSKQQLARLSSRETLRHLSTDLHTGFQTFADPASFIRVTCQTHEAPWKALLLSLLSDTISPSWGSIWGEPGTSGWQPCPKWFYRFLFFDFFPQALESEVSWFLREDFLPKSCEFPFWSSLKSFRLKTLCPKLGGSLALYLKGRASLSQLSSHLEGSTRSWKGLSRGFYLER